MRSDRELLEVSAEGLLYSDFQDVSCSKCPLSPLQVSIMAALRHPNVVMFMGLCLEPPCIVTEFCARGSLYDVLKKARASPAFAQQLDWSKRLSMALDAAKVASLLLLTVLYPLS